MAFHSHLRLALRQISDLQVAAKSIQAAQTVGTCARHAGSFENRRALNQTFFTLHTRCISTSKTTPSLLRPFTSTSTLITSTQQSSYFSSTPPPSSEHKLSTKATSDPFTEATSDKGIFAKLWDRYSFEGQTKRIILGERLFRAAQIRANDVRWFREGRIPYEFRPRHAILTMHVWFLHKRLLADRVDPHAALLVQEELFDILWNDTRARIRAEGVNELTVNKHLKDAQQLTFLHCTHYDHAFQEYAKDPQRRLEELAAAIWVHVLNRDEECYNAQLNRMAAYVEYQFMNIVLQTPDDYFWEGRIPWGDVPDFTKMEDNTGKMLEEVRELPKGFVDLPKPWIKTLTDAGDTYYWNRDTNETSWKKPVKSSP